MMTACNTEKDQLVTIHTPYGDMKLVLYDVTPQHKANFLKLAAEGMYDSTNFHRVMQGFMIQGGDVLQKKGADPNNEEIKKIGQNTLAAEFVDTLFHKKGALAAARQPDEMNPEKRSSGSQFYIVQGNVFTEDQLTTDQEKLNNGIRQLLQMEGYDSLRQELIGLYQTGDYDAYTKKVMELKPVVENELNIKLDKEISPERLEAYTTQGGAPHLDDTYTVFGEVVDGLEVIDEIAEQPTGAAHKPEEDIYMTVTVEELPKKKITELYGFQYPTPEK
jgi:peptidyl-prolyl cis-trans isomerase B (cyclophilin B)